MFAYLVTQETTSLFFATQGLVNVEPFHQLLSQKKSEPNVLVDVGWIDMYANYSVLFSVKKTVN